MSQEYILKVMQRFESLLIAPATILGTPVEAGLNQKNSTSLTLGTQTAFDFHPPPADLTPRCSRRLNPKMLNGARKNLPNLSLSFVIYLRDTTLEAVSCHTNRVLCTRLQVHRLKH
jgi:hypothetical protein